VRTVVDASVAAKWYFPESGQASAASLLADQNDGRRELIAPDLIELELANVLWKKVRLRECSEENAHEVLALWDSDRPRLVASRWLVERALELGLRLDHPIYDCLYVAAAIEYGAALATADRQLERVARTVLGEVLRIGD
jgi:predicted nucleic acid-binding protein